MTDFDERTEITISKSKTGMYDKEETHVTLKSKSENLDTLIKKAREVL